MGGLLEVPEWVAGILAVAFFCSAIGLLAWRNTSRQITRTLERRPNLNRTAFLEGMSDDASRQVSEFLWESAQPHLDCFGRELSLHPDDDLARDLPIAEEDWSMDWPREWAEKQGFHESNYPDWPEDWPITVRNFAKWLDMAPV